MLTASSPGLGSFIDDLVGGAVTSATAAAQPLITEVENKLEALLLPVIVFTAGSFLLNLLTYRAVTHKAKALSGLRSRR